MNELRKSDRNCLAGAVRDEIQGASNLSTAPAATGEDPRVEYGHVLQ